MRVPVILDSELEGQGQLEVRPRLRLAMSCDYSMLQLRTRPWQLWQPDKSPMINV